MRIKSIARLINKANVCVDVGSDHAHLSLLLIKENRSNFVYNIEKNLGPLNSSIKNTKNFCDKIFNIKSDGFKSFDSSIKIDYVVIAGMGCNTIIDILQNCNNQVDNFIICSNNGYDKLRKWIKKNKYKIFHELTVNENNIFYEIICFSKTKGFKIWTHHQELFGIRKIKKNDYLYIDKLKDEIKSKDLNTIKNRNKKMYQKILKIERYIKKYETN